MEAKFKIILILLSSFLAVSVANAEDSGLGQLFRERNIKGTIIISSLGGETEYFYNRARATKRFLPASTFKIPNTLIALDEKIIVNEKQIIKWDGKDRGWSPWNQDQSLETAFPISCVWFYQELAKRIGNINYLSHLDRLNYGNKKTGPGVTTFWLEGELAISARGQIEFLKKFYKEDLPYKKSHLQLLKNIMIVEKKPRYIIRGKTGWAMHVKNQYGWYVGYVETDQKVWFFAMNSDIGKKTDAVYRKEITMEALKVKGII
ncbi:MAG: class D beta-lactamase [Desulfobacteraceae bacterium]|nr:class D beta-lactamase [Desulfobacteraceae bacterium]